MKTRLLQLVLWDYSPLFLLAALAAVTESLPFIGTRAWAFGLVWAVIAAVLLFVQEPLHPRASRTTGALLATIIAVGTALRFLPYRSTSVPLGYDYGFYARTFDHYATATRPVLDAPPWMHDQFPPGLPLLHALLEGVAGIDAHTHLTVVWPLLASAMALPVFAAVRTYKGDGPALLSSAIYVVAMPTYSAYAYLYEKQLLALGLLVLVWFLLRQAPLMAGVAAATAMIMHRPTAILVGIVLVAAWLRRPSMRSASAGAVAGTIALPVWLIMWDTFVARIAPTLGAAGDAVTGTSAGTGTYLATPVYLQASAPYLALGLAAYGLVRRREVWPPLAALSVAIVWFAFGLPLHQRFLIAVDGLAILLAGATLWQVVPRRVIRRVAAGLVVLLAVIPSLGVISGDGVPHRFVDDDQWEGIEWIADSLPDDAVVLADNLRAPYIMGATDLSVYGPGLFDDPHNRTEWNQMMTTSNQTFAREFLAVYGAPLFLFTTQVPGPDFLSRLTAQDMFQVAYDGDGSTVWLLVEGA